MNAVPGTVGRLGLSPRALALFTPSRLRSLPAPLARRPEMRALTYAALADHGARPEELAHVRAAYLAALAANVARLRRLDGLLRSFRAEGLRVLVMKGGLLARTHYGDPGARPMADFDLVCRPEERQRAAHVIVHHGFRARAHEPRRIATGALHDSRFSDGRGIVELHHRLWHELGLPSDVAPVVERASSVPFGTGVAWAPAPADHLYIVLVHAATHAFTGNPLWMTDALLLADRPSLWWEVHRLAEAHGAALPVAAAIEHLMGVFPGLVPGDVPGAKAPAPARRFLLRRLAGALQPGTERRGLWPSRLARALLVESPWHFGRWALGKVRLALAVH